MPDSQICVSKRTLIDAQEELKKYVDYIDKLSDRAKHGFANGDMDRIDMIISQIKSSLAENKSC